MTNRHDDYMYSKIEVCHLLGAHSYQYDKKLIKKGQDPDKLRSVLADIINDDYKKTKIVEWRHSCKRIGTMYEWYLDNKIDETERFPKNDSPTIWFYQGIILQYCVNYDSILVLNYDPNHINGELDGEVVYGGLSCMLYKLKADNTLDWTDDYWDEGKEYSNNIVELFNLHPRIIVDLCYISDIGSTKLLKMIKLNQYMLKNSEQICCHVNEIR